MSPLRPDDLKPPFVEASALHIEDPGFATVISLDRPPQVTANQKRGVQLDLTSTVERSNQLQPYAQLISFQSVLKEGRAFLGMSTEQKASQNGDCNSPVTAPPGAWKDGRTLSEAQRERKRAVNRLNRRLQRQNKREDQIAALELQLERLKGQEDSPTRSIENGFNVWDPGSSESPSAAVYSGSHSDSPKCQFDPPYSPSLGYSKLFEEEEKNVPKLEQRLTAASPYLMRESSARDITQMLNIGIGMALTASIEDISTDAVFNESVLSHAIIYGWKSSIEKHQPTCPMLNALRYLDETLFHEAGPLERLAMMHCISRQLLTLRLGSTDERQAAWPWYKPRPSQLSARHDIAVDYIVWPGMRERLIFMGATALTNAFWANFFRNFRFYWPSDIKEAFQLTEDSQLLAFSGELQNRFRDLPHWRMDTEFLNKFPDFVCDVQAYESIPTTLELWKPVDPVRLRRLVLRNSDKRKAEKDDDRLQFSL